jgi:hypothetical protein
MDIRQIVQATFLAASAAVAACRAPAAAQQATNAATSQWYRVTVESDRPIRVAPLRVSDPVSGLERQVAWTKPAQRDEHRWTSHAIFAEELPPSSIRLKLGPDFRGTMKISSAEPSEGAQPSYTIVRTKPVRVPHEKSANRPTAAIVLARDPGNAPTIVLIHPPGPVLPKLAAGELERLAAELRQRDPSLDATVVVLEDHLNLPTAKPPVRWMHQHWLDSPVNGAWRNALINDLLPSIQAVAPGILNPDRTLIAGHGPGSWAAWWLFRDLEWPDGNADSAKANRFRACALVEPEPFDDEHVTVEEDGNRPKPAVAGSLGRLLPGAGGPESQAFADALRRQIRAEDELIAAGKNPRQGMSVNSFERALSTGPEIGRFMDRSTGAFDELAVRRWSGQLRDPWSVEVPKADPRAAGIRDGRPTGAAARLFVLHSLPMELAPSGGDGRMVVERDGERWSFDERNDSVEQLAHFVESVLRRCLVEEGAGNGHEPR